MEVEKPQLAHGVMTMDSPDEAREREAFSMDLHRFCAEVGKPLSKIPIMGYKELDLFQLYKEVVARGGFNEVVRRVGTWSKIWKRLSNFDPSITDSSFRLRKNYERYLLEYEFYCHPEHRGKNNVNLPSWMGSMGFQASRSSSTNSLNSLAAGSSSKKRSKKVKIGGTTSAVRLPLTLEDGELTILSLGELTSSRQPFVTDSHIWPIGYTATRAFVSSVNPSSRTIYTCKIVEGVDGRPQFVVEAADNKNQPVVSHSPSAAWRVIAKRVSDALASQAPEQEQGPPGSPTHNSDFPSDENADSPLRTQRRHTVSTPNEQVAAGIGMIVGGRVRGAVQFGLSNPVVSEMLNDMLPSMSRSTSMSDLGALKRKSSEMCLADLGGSDEDEPRYVPRATQRKKAKEIKEFNLFANMTPLTPKEEDNLVENAVALLTQWQGQRSGLVC